MALFYRECLEPLGCPILPAYIFPHPDSDYDAPYSLADERQNLEPSKSKTKGKVKDEKKKKWRWRERRRVAFQFF